MALGRAASALALLAALVPAPGGAVAAGWTTFTDPTDRAFTLEVPAGWQVTGGVVHHGLRSATWYVDAISPDGITELAIGDIGLAPFALGSDPKPPPPPKDKGKKGGHAAAAGPSAMPYLPGPKFAAWYGQELVHKRHLCPSVRVVAENVEPNPPGYGALAKAESGEAFLVCTERSRIVYDLVTTLPPAAGAASWEAKSVANFVAPASDAEDALRVLMHMLASWRFDEGWVERMTALGVAVPQAKPGEWAHWVAEWDRSHRALPKDLNGIITSIACAGKPRLAPYMPECSDPRLLDLSPKSDPSARQPFTGKSGR